MMLTIGNERHVSVKRLFTHYPYVHGCVAAVIDGGMGNVFTDVPHDPNVALAELDFQFLAGDPTHAAARPLLKLLRPGRSIIAPTAGWRDLLYSVFPGRMATTTREAFTADAFDVKKLQVMVNSVPATIAVRPVRLDEVQRFVSELDHSLAYNFNSYMDFITNGVGIGALHDGHFVAGASSYAVGGGLLEIQVCTRPDYRRRGLARAVAASLMLHCLERGLQPCWDAAGDQSAELARQLGYRSLGKYSAYTLNMGHAAA